jgi:hypothetical protein
MRHALGVLGVLAAGVLLAVSCAMNWRFGVSLGRTEFDGQIYGAASAAADCMKALVPFFFFASVRNKMWSQALASALVWVVVTAYSLTSALGHAALNRLDTAGQRVATADSYKDHRADLARAQEQLSWVPQHRPAQAVEADISALKDERMWTATEQCANVTGSKGRGFCQKYHALSAELASAQQSIALEARIAEIQAKMTNVTGAMVMSEADPQAAVLAKLAALIAPSIKVEDIQTALTVFVALLLEVGSGFGMYIAFSQWRLYDSHTPAAPRIAPVSTAAAAVAAPPKEKAVAIAKPRSGANDNKSAPAQRLIAPETDVERFYKERIETQDGSSLTATSLYEDYCAWCEEQQKEPLALPTFGREFGELGVQKARIAGRVRYIGIALKSAGELEEDKKLPALGEKAA